MERYIEQLIEDIHKATWNIRPPHEIWEQSGDDSDFDPPVNELIDFEMINGFYDDDGNKIDPNSVSIPGLCIICKQYQLDDSEENLLCLMNRYDQRNESNFKCGAYEKN